MSRSGHQQSAVRGFTLLELLMVVFCIAIVAGAAILISGDTQSYVESNLVEKEIRAVRDAILSFRQDTGFTPKTGPFALSIDGGQVATPADGADWFTSPANLCQLFQEPVDAAGLPVLRWNPDTGRGWRGPYLRRGGEGYVDIGADLTTNGLGSPTWGNRLMKVPAIADPFQHPPVGNDNKYLTWYTEPLGPPLAHHGRPYLLFDVNDRDMARLVSMGENGVYDAADLAEPGDDIVLFLFR